MVKPRRCISYMTVFDHGCRGGLSPVQLKGSLTKTHFGIVLALSSFDEVKSFPGDDGSYPSADAKSQGGELEIAVANGSRSSRLKLKRCPSLGL